MKKLIFFILIMAICFTGCSASINPLQDNTIEDFPIDKTIKHISVFDMELCKQKDK